MVVSKRNTRQAGRDDHHVNILDQRSATHSTKSASTKSASQRSRPVSSLFIGLVKLSSSASQTREVIAGRAERDFELSMWVLIEAFVGNENSAI